MHKIQSNFQMSKRICTNFDVDSGNVWVFMIFFDFFQGDSTHSGVCITYLAQITFQGRNPSNIFVGNLEKRRHHKFILRLSDL